MVTVFRKKDLIIIRVRVVVREEDWGENTLLSRGGADFTTKQGSIDRHVWLLEEGRERKRERKNAM